MATVAAALTSTFGAALLRPGDTERDVGLRYAETLRNLGPLAGSALTQMLNLRMREQIHQAVIGQAELQSGRLPGSQPVTVGFVDIVGFTRLGEEVPPEELGALVRDFERSVEAVAQPPVRLVKTIGDAAMLVAPDAPPLIDATLSLVEDSRTIGDRPLLRGGVASGDALHSRSSRGGGPSWRRRTCTTRRLTATRGRLPAATASRACAARSRCTGRDPRLRRSRSGGCRDRQPGEVRPPCRSSPT
jgi:adenylate cyclase